MFTKLSTDRNPAMLHMSPKNAVTNRPCFGSAAMSKPADGSPMATEGQYKTHAGQPRKNPVRMLD